MKRPRAKRVKKPRHGGEIRAWRFALRLNQDVTPLHEALDIACALRNDIAAQRIENGRAISEAKREGCALPQRLTKRDQEMYLAERRRREPGFAGRLHSLVVKNIADRIDEGWKRFWEARADGRVAVAPPRPVLRKRYRSLTYPQYGNGVRIRSGRVELAMIGSFRLHDHRKIRGRVQTVTLKWAQGRWWCIVTTKLPASAIYHPAKPDAVDVGADPGLTAVMTFSDGRKLDPPRALDAALGKLRREQRKLSRKFEIHKTRQAERDRAARAEGWPVERLALSNRLRKQIARVGKVHTKVVNIRDHWHKLGARRTEQRYDRVACEDHGAAFMIRNRRLARSASDRALSAQKQALASALGPRLVMVPNRRPGIGGNSQTCLCGASVPKALSERWHECDACGISAPRDVVAANIAEAIGFGTNKLTTAPGRGPIDVEGAMASARDSAPATGVPPVRALLVASTSGNSRSDESTACGHGPGWKARLDAIGPVPLAREPKPLDRTLGKHPALAG